MPEALYPTTIPCVSLSFRLLEESQNCNAAPDSRLVAEARTLPYSPRNPTVQPNTWYPGDPWWVLMEPVGPETTDSLIPCLTALPHGLSLPGWKGRAPEVFLCFSLTQAEWELAGRWRGDNGWGLSP